MAGENYRGATKGPTPTRGPQSACPSMTPAQGFWTPGVGAAHTTPPKEPRPDVDWATQMSYSGIFVHSAPWSVGAQGHTNTSHGCLNVSPSNAEWFYDHSKSGDIVEVINTVGPTLPGTEGLGDWNVPWPVWKAGNANAG